MDVLLDGKQVDLKGVQHELNLMTQERIMCQFLRDDNLAWFFHYQLVDIHRLETILSQARAQYPTLPDDEKQFVDVLSEFYDDFRAFNWGFYRRLCQEPDPINRLGYEAETALRWGRKLRELTETIEPLNILLQSVETKYKIGPHGIGRPSTFD